MPKKNGHDEPSDARRRIADLKRLASGIIRAQGNRFIKELMREKGIRVGANKSEFQANLFAAIEAGDLSLEDIQQWLHQVEGWGNQHVYLFGLPPSIRRLLEPEAVRRRARAAQLGHLWDRPTVLEYPDRPTLTSIAFQEGVMRLVWQEASPGWTQVPERNYTQEEGLDRFEFRAYRMLERRAVSRFEAHLQYHLAALFIADPIASKEHEEMKEEAERVIGLLLDGKALAAAAINISIVCRNLDQRNVPDNTRPVPPIKTQKAQLGSGGAYVAFASRSSDRAYWEEDAVRDVRLSVRGAQLPAFQGDEGVFLLPGKDGRDLRIQLYGRENRIRLWKQMDAEEVWEVLRTLSTYQ